MNTIKEGTWCTRLPHLTIMVFVNLKQDIKVCATR